MKEQSREGLRTVGRGFVCPVHLWSRSLSTSCWLFVQECGVFEAFERSEERSISLHLDTRFENTLTIKVELVVVGGESEDVRRILEDTSTKRHIHHRRQFH